MKKNHLVVGSGVSGLLIANVLQKHGHQVTMVESASKFGGLLGTSFTEENLVFDYGTHLVPETGIAEVDDITLGEKQSYTENWQKFPFIKAGNYTLGTLNDKSSSINLHDLDAADYAQACVEFLNMTPDEEQPENALDKLVSDFGKTVAEKVYQPGAEKLFGRKVEELIPDAHLLFMPSRVILGSPEMNREIKQSEFFNQRVSFSTYKEGLSNAQFYPQKNGIADWVNQLMDSFLHLGGELVLNHTVMSVEQDSGQLNVTLSNGSIAEVSQLWWTASPYFLFKTMDFELPKLPPVTFRQTHLVHLVFDKPFDTDLYYFPCFDPSVKAFRVTLYPNMMEAPVTDGKYHCTVEVLNDQKTMDEAALVKQTHQELVQMGVVNSAANLTSSHLDSIGNTFPVKDFNFKQMVEAFREAETRLPENIRLSGAARGEHFFMRDVLVDTYHKVMAVIGESK